MGTSINLPFRFDESGSVSVTTDEATTWANRVVAVLMTRPSERLMRPPFGSRVTEAVFETEQDAIAIVQREVPAAFARWLPDLRLIHVSASLDKGELADNALTISVEYLLPDKRKNVTTATVKLGSFTPTGVLIEEIQ